MSSLLQRLGMTLPIIQAPMAGTSTPAMAAAVTNAGGLVAGAPSSLMASQAGFYDGPWEALGITRSAFTTALGSPSGSPSSYNGFVWIDNNSILNDGTGA